MTEPFVLLFQGLAALLILAALSRPAGRGAWLAGFGLGIALLAALMAPGVTRYVPIVVAIVLAGALGTVLAKHLAIGRLHILLAVLMGCAGLAAGLAALAVGMKAGWNQTALTGAALAVPMGLLAVVDTVLRLRRRRSKAPGGFDFGRSPLAPASALSLAGLGFALSSPLLVGLGGLAAAMLARLPR